MLLRQRVLEDYSEASSYAIVSLCTLSHQKGVRVFEMETRLGRVCFLVECR